MSRAALVMAQHQVEEGKTRIARCEALIEKLVRGGHEYMLPEARDMLARIRDFQAQAEERLAQEQAREKP